MNISSTQGEKKAVLQDQRAAQRFGLAVRVTVEGGEGATHDISATGLYFASDTSYVPGQVIEMVLEFPGAKRTRQLTCEAEVVRVTPVGEGFNVAVRLVTPLFAES
ncbi:MAG: PilZ domain-containing protein [Pseudomonadota bacterium]|uniref:PilZ domain-containing protein n=1 Tax=Polaromonas sp. TaxID=1869339 RepID=UPI0017B687BD|nr:PilZ domain-containing protein [Polaromonas sp.]MBA3594224.1 PilZ domain-containing protein [Polaromonas sp.]MDQ3271503.1 PilZ domain-containing protein [Pseudomonadota bacterium]